MRTNLIQSYIQQNNTQAVQQYHSDNAKKNFDIHKELSNRTFIKPLPSNGHLVRNSLFDMPAEFFKDLKYKTKAFHKSIKGTANDNELGSLNDIGMKLGGLSIATYLFSRKSAPIAKAMEFVGLASFFAAMDIWPKLALQLPAYLIHGFDIRQQYRDNFGIKKPVFQDHQFIPWDLYSDEEINKIGDRMGVPKNMKNRRDFIQEKMRKTALQNNTMWMLTSGFATPIMSALICESLQKPIAKYQDKRVNKKAENLLKNFKTEIAKYDFTEKTKQLEGLIEGNKGKNITKDIFEKISKLLTEGLDSITGKAVIRDLKNILLPKEYDISPQTFTDLGDIMKTNIEGLTEKEISDITPSAAEIIEKLPENKKNMLKNGETIHGVTEFSDYVKAFMNAIDDKVDQLTGSKPENKLYRKMRFALDNMFEKIEENGSSILDKILKKTHSAILDDGKIEKLKTANETLNTLCAKQSVLNKYVYLKAAQAPETYLANTWNSVLSDDLLKTLGITDKDIKSTRMDSNLVNELLRNKMEEIVSDDVKYNQVMDKIIEKLNFLEDRTNFAQYGKYEKDETNSYKALVDKTFDKSSKTLQDLGMKYSAQRLTGYAPNDEHTLKDLQLSFMQDRVRGVKSSFYRLLNTLDFFKKVYDGENLDSLGGYKYYDNAGNLIKETKYTRELKEEMVELAKQLLVGGRTSDYEVKFFYLRNPDLNPTDEAGKARVNDFSDIKGKTERTYRYLGKTAEQELADNPHDRIFYDSTMRSMYSDKLSSKTSEKIANSTFQKNFEQYRKELLSYLGGSEYFVKKNHKVNGKEVKSSTDFRFQLLGSAVDDMFTKFFSTKYNSTKWLNMFGGFGVALLGITVLSQFFMGYINSDKVPKENK